MKIKSTFRILASLALLQAFHATWAQPAKLAQIVLQATPVVTLTVTPTTVGSGSSARFDVNISGVPAAIPTGSISYLIKPTSGSASLTSVVSVFDGAASWTTSPPTGDYTISAVYSGDTNYRAQSASSTGTVTAPPPDFEFSVSPLTIRQGQTWTGIVQVNPINGFAQTVTFACVAPLALGCSFPTTSYSFAQPNASSSKTGIPLTVTAYPGQFTSASLLMFTFLSCSRKWRKLRMWICIALGSVGLLAIAGCGTSGNAGWQPITPKGKYQATITGVSGSLIHTKQLTIIVE